MTSAEQNNSNIEREELAIVFVVTRLKQCLHGRRFTLHTHHKPLKYLFAPDEEIPKTALARITRWAIALMGFDYELKYTLGEQTPHADALSRMDFDNEESDKDQVFFASNNIYFAQSDLVTQAEIKTEPRGIWNKQTLPGHNEMNQKRQLETLFRRGKRTPTTERCTCFT